LLLRVCDAEAAIDPFRKITVRIDACHIHHQYTNISSIIVLSGWSAIFLHAIVVLVLLRDTIWAKINIIHSIIDLIINIFNVIYALVWVLLLPAFIYLGNFSTLLLSLIISIRGDPLPLEHAAVATCGACFFESPIVVLIINDINYISTFIDFKRVIRCVLLIYSYYYGGAAST
jgi:hypothetical protein